MPLISLSSRAILISEFQRRLWATLELIARQASVDQSAQRTNKGWKNNRINLARSLSNPKASTSFIYCEMLPGKIAKKKSAVAIPTAARRCRELSNKPSVISTTPDASTTKSAESGIQLGTCAWNSRRLVVRCKIPV